MEEWENNELKVVKSHLDLQLNRDRLPSLCGWLKSILTGSVESVLVELSLGASNDMKVLRHALCVDNEANDDDPGSVFASRRADWNFGSTWLVRTGALTSPTIFATAG